MVETMYRELVFRMFLNILHMKIIGFPILPNDTLLITTFVIFIMTLLLSIWKSSEFRYFLVISEYGVYYER